MVAGMVDGAKVTLGETGMQAPLYGKVSVYYKEKNSRVLEHLQLMRSTSH